MRRIASCLFAIACGSDGSANDAGLDVAPEAPPQCEVPQADGGTPTYRWSFDQKTVAEDNGLIPPLPQGLASHGIFLCSGGPNCGCYLDGDFDLGDIGANRPAPTRWRISAWFRGGNNGVLFELEGIQLRLESEELTIALAGTPSTYTTLLVAGDGAWHAIALQVDATVTPLSIEVLLDKDGPYQSPSSLSWTLGTSTDLVVGGAANEFDEVSFFLYE
jgi:hypothetical protein